MQWGRKKIKSVKEKALGLLDLLFSILSPLKCVKAYSGLCTKVVLCNLGGFIKDS